MSSPTAGSRLPRQTTVLTFFGDPMSLGNLIPILLEYRLYVHAAE